MRIVETIATSAVCILDFLQSLKEILGVTKFDEVESCGRFLLSCISLGNNTILQLIILECWELRKERESINTVLPAILLGPRLVVCSALPHWGVWSMATCVT